MRICKLALISQKKEKIALTLLIAVILLSGIATANAGSGVEISNPTGFMPDYKRPGDTVLVIFTFYAEDTNELATITVFKGATVIGLTTHELKGLIPFQPYTFYVDVFLSNYAPDGLYDVKVDVTGYFGTGTDIELEAVIIDTVAPVISLPSPVGWVSVADPTISAKITDADPSSGIDVGSIVMKLDDVPVVGHVYDPGTGLVSFDATGLGEGEHDVTVDVKDKAGNPATQLKWSFSVDLTKPVISIPSPVGWVSVANPTISATISDDAPSSGIDEATIIMTLDGTPVTTPTYAGGVVSFDATGLDEGEHDVTVDVSDNVGNEAIQLAWSFSVDLEPPVVTIDTVTTPTNEDTQTITGTYVEEDLVDIVVNGKVADIDKPGLGDWTAFDVPLLLEGSNEIIAMATALSGNTGTDKAYIVLDRVAPVISIPSPVGWIKIADPTISATITDASSGIDETTIKMTLDGAPVTPIYAGGVVSFSAVDLIEGAHSVTVDVSDKAGNPASASWSFTVDTISPVVTIDAVTTPTNVNTQTITGTYIEDNLDKILVNGIEADTSVAGKWTIVDVPLTEGSNTITVMAKDLAGNTVTVIDYIVLDTVAPVISIPSPVGWVSVANPTISATITDADSGIDVSSIAMTLDGAPVTPLDYAGGVVSFGATGLTEGTYPVTVAVSDLAGNSATLPWSFTVDLTDPVVTINTVTTPTNEESQTITGTYIEDNLDKILVNGIEAEIDVPNLKWTAFNVPLPLEGSNTINAVAKDKAGNTGQASTTIVRDSVAPVIVHEPLYALQAAGPYTVEATITDERLDTNTLQVCYSLDGVLWQPLLMSSVIDDLYTASIPDQLDGIVVQYYIQASDSVGNTATHPPDAPTSYHYFTIDKVLPTLTIEVPDFSGGLTTITVTSNEELKVPPTVKVTDPDAVLHDMTGTGALIAPLTWSYEFTVSIHCTHSVHAEGIDLAGNTGTADTTFEGDLIPPSISDMAPEGYVTTNTPTISAKLDDIKSGVDPNTVHMMLDTLIYLDAYGYGTAKWTVHNAELYVGDGSSDWAEVSIPVNIAIKDINELKFWEYIDSYSPKGWKVQVVLGVDLNGNEVFDSDLATWHFTTDLAEKAVALAGDSFISLEQPEGGDPATGGLLLVNSLAETKCWEPTGTVAYLPFGEFLAALPGASGIQPESLVKEVILQIGGCGNWMDETAYVGDVTINGVTYDLSSVGIYDPDTGIVSYTPTTGLTEGTHTVIVDVSDLVGNSADTAIWEFFVDTEAPTAPVLTAVSKPIRIELDWDEASDPGYLGTPATGSGVACYNIYRGLIDNKEAIMANQIVTCQPDTYYEDEDEDLIEGTTYYYVVTAVDNAGNEGDPSNIAGAIYFEEIKPIQYEVELLRGWNLISLPLIPEDPRVVTLLEGMEGIVDKVWTYDAATGEWTYVAYNEYNEEWVGDLENMVDGKGYWIYMTAETTLSGIGYEMIPAATLPAYPVYAGWNLIGFKTYDLSEDDVIELACMPGGLYLNSYFAEHLGSFWQMMSPDMAIWNLLPQKGFTTYNAEFAEFGFKPLFESLTPGEGYWIYVTEDGTIAPSPPQQTPD